MPSNLDFLDSIGTKRSSTTVTISSIESILYDWAGKVIQDAQAILEKSGSIASGKLSSNIKILPVEFAGSKYVLKVSLQDYYDFINKGVSGTENKRNSPYSFKTSRPSKAMATQILKWLRQGTNKVRDKKPRNKSYGVLEKKNKGLAKIVNETESLKSVAYAISTSIKKKGIRATHFLDDAVSKNYPLLKKQLEKALKDDIGIVVRQINVE